MDRSGWIMSTALAMKLPSHSVDMLDWEFTTAVTHKTSQYRAPNYSKCNTQVNNFTDITVSAHAQ